jgi:hypothetical protein
MEEFFICMLSHVPAVHFETRAHGGVHRITKVLSPNLLPLNTYRPTDNRELG